MFHGWMFDPDGDQAAADSTRSSSSLDTGSSVNPRTDRRLVTASYTSIIHRLARSAHTLDGERQLVKWRRWITSCILDRQARDTSRDAACDIIGHVSR